MSSKGHLLRILGLTFGIAVSIGGTIGAGILRTPGIVAAQLPNFWWIIAAWVCGGIYAFLGTISVAELGAALPKAGGWYVYARRALGNYGGFTVGWSDWMAQSAALAWLATAVGEFASALLPSLSIKGVAIAVLVIFAILHWMGLRLSSRAQEITTLMKAIGLFVFVALCFTAPKSPTTPAAILPKTALFAALIIALQGVISTYDGWYSANYFAEEDMNPGKNIPRSVISSILLTIVIYLLVVLALLHVLSISELSAATLPAADAAQKIFGGNGGKIITLLALISLLSVINALLMLTPRILFALSRDGFFFSKASEVNAGGTPVYAMWITTFLAIVLIATGTFNILLAVTAFLYVLIYVSGFISLFILRKREPDLPRPFRVWGYPWTTLLALLISLGFLISAVIGDTTNSLRALLMIAVSYPVYLIAKRAT